MNTKGNIVTERSPAGGIVYRAPKNVVVPDVDVLTLLFDSAYNATAPNKEIHVSAADPSRSISHSRTNELTRVTAAALRNNFSIGASGPNKDIVSVISTGHYLLPVLFYGIIAAGGVFSAASSASTAKDLSKQIKEASSKILVCVRETQNVAVKAAEDAGWGKGGGGRVLLMGEEDWSLIAVGSTKELIDESQKLEWERITDKANLKDSLVVLIYSSGTTGLPKGVMLSHQNLVSEAVIPGQLFHDHVSTDPSRDFEYRTLAHLPIAHIAGIQGYFINPVRSSGTTYWMSRFSFPDFLAYNQKFRITFFFTVPPIYLLIAKSPLVKDQFDTLVVAVSGAAPLGKEIQNAASKKLGRGKCSISQTWGLSETTGSTTSGLGFDDDTGSVANIIPNCSLRIVEDDDTDVKPGAAGEILVQGPVVCIGYHNNATANAEAFTSDGWFRTGDIGLVKDGLLYIVDRKKELIKYKGMQVAPAELEALLLSHPDVLDAAVIGVEAKGSQGTSEVPRAYIVANQKKITAEDIVAWVAKEVANHKQLRGGVVFLNEIPKSPAGKILRKDLRALLKRDEGARL